MNPAFILVLLGFCLSLALTPAVIAFGNKQMVLDHPDGKRKLHSRPVSPLGGVAVFVAFSLVSMISSIVYGNPYPLPVFLGLTVIFLTGLLDDILSFSPCMKLGGQLLGIVLLMWGGIVIQFFTLPGNGLVFLGVWGYPLTVLWFVGIINALNLIDGMDGLSGGVTFIAALTLGVIAWQEGRMEPALMSFILVASVAGFLPFNFPPARVFLGDGGALFLGAVLATVSVEGAVKGAATFTLAAPILALGVPISDTIFAIVRRSRNRLPIMFPDRGHLHHRLLEKGYSHRKVVLTVYGISGAFGAVAIAMDRLIPHTTYSLLLFLVLFGILWRWGKQLGLMEITGGDRTGE